MKNKLKISNYRFVTVLASFVICYVLLIPTTNAGNIDPANSFVWGENVGWINFGSAQGDVDVSLGGMDGYAWGENVGWISLTCNNTTSCATVSYGVIITGSAVSGYAWGENVGWISFSCTNTASCGTVSYGVSIDITTGDFSGYAWGENVGWVVFNCATTGSCGTNSYKLRTTAAPATGTGGTGPLPTSSATPFPTATAVPTSSPGVSVTPQPSVTPGVSPSPFPTPTTPPPTVTPTTSPPPLTPGIPPVLRLIDRFAAWLDNLIAFLFSLFGLQDVCVGSLGLAACGATAVTAIVVVAALLAALMQGEIAAIGYGMLYFFGVRHKTKVWGVVYDSRTKRPIPLAKLELFDESNRLLETRYADRDGRFGFLMSPASMHTSELHVQVKASKTGYVFPSAGITSGTDYIVYDNVYRGGMIVMKAETLLNYNIPMDPVAATRTSWSGFGRGLVGSLGDKLLAFGFYVGLVVIPLNYWFRPTTTNLVIGIIFIAVNLIRMLVLHRPYGVTTDALTGKTMPYALVTLNDLEGNRQGFAVSDEQGRFILSGEQNKDYELLAYTPANIIPQRSVRLRVRGVRRMSTRAWITNNLRI